VTSCKITELTYGYDNIHANASAEPEETVLLVAINLWDNFAAMMLADTRHTIMFFRWKYFNHTVTLANTRTTLRFGYSNISRWTPPSRLAELSYVNYNP
jgi:hypothetical protein